MSLAGVKLVVLKMLPFDNKSEFQVVRRHAGGHAAGGDGARCCARSARTSRTVPEVTDYQAYAGTAAPINFNGLVRQYYLRAGAGAGRHPGQPGRQAPARPQEPRDRRWRCAPASRRIAQKHGGDVKVVEVPPGPPVLSPIVAEIYGPDYAGAASRSPSRCAARSSRPPTSSASTTAVEDDARRSVLRVDQSKAALLGVAQKDIVEAMRIGLAGENVTPVHGGDSQVRGPGAHHPAAGAPERASTSC
ncbi:MAG: hypothetical protein MZW92_79980 [Comamonadaceae bacterium]|nr:hypothetical protein [Comamonadaceae bacterium]